MAGLHPNPLVVPYQRQGDNRSGQGWRECFSSSAAMLAMYWGKIANDDAYNQVRQRFGDTTSNQAQLAALRSLGLDAHFSTNGDSVKLQLQIGAGRPVAVGWLHHGPASAPTGGGHWTVIIGYTDTHWIHHDPNGEADMVNGGYLPNLNGAGLRYSRKNWNPRWRVDNTGGWMLTCRPA